MSGMTPVEGRVMDLYEAGSHPRDIARELGVTPGRIRAIISTFRIDASEPRRSRRRMEACSQTLLTALQREGFA